MAAHIKTGLEQVIADIDRDTLNKDVIEAACNLDCWTADIINCDYQDTPWNNLRKWIDGDIDIKELKDRLERALFQANIEWVELGQPKTREEWYRAKYPKMA